MSLSPLKKDLKKTGLEKEQTESLTTEVGAPWDLLGPTEPAPALIGRADDQAAEVLRSLKVHRVWEGAELFCEYIVLEVSHVCSSVKKHPVLWGFLFVSCAFALSASLVLPLPSSCQLSWWLSLCTDASLGGCQWTLVCCLWLSYIEAFFFFWSVVTLLFLLLLAVLLES